MDGRLKRLSKWAIIIHALFAKAHFILMLIFNAFFAAEAKKTCFRRRKKSKKYLSRKDSDEIGVGSCRTLQCLTVMTRAVVVI